MEEDRQALSRAQVRQSVEHVVFGTCVWDEDSYASSGWGATSDDHCELGEPVWAVRVYEEQDRLRRNPASATLAWP